jgi:AP-4 complex subunit epsilon-1
MYSILETLGNRLLKSNKTSEFAILYQFIYCITSIYPTSNLLTIAFNAINLYFANSSPNLNYFGIKSIIQLMKVDVSYANSYQDQVLECIDHYDESIRRLTLSILFELSNQNNVQVIVEKLVSVLKKTQELYLRKELVHKIIQIVQRFSPNIQWSLQTICLLFDIAGDFIDEHLIRELLEMFSDINVTSKFEEVLDNILKSKQKDLLMDSYLQFFIGVIIY